MHYEFRVNRAKHPNEFFSQVKVRLAECLSGPMCLAEDSLKAYQELYI